MGLDGGSSDESIEHDDVTSKQHEIDKRAQSRRMEMDWLGIPKGGEFAFKNDFSAIEKHEALYYFLGGIPEVRAKDLKPEDEWEVSGTMASYSAGTEIAAYRDFCRSQNRSQRGRKGEEDSLGPPPPPPSLGQARRRLSLDRLESRRYKEQLRMVRDETDCYHCWGTGADGRQYWKKAPIASKSKLIEGELSADQLDEEEYLVGFEPEGPKNESRKVKTNYEMRRFTINSHPALARAMSKMVEEGRKEEVRDLMERAIPRVVAAFERVTGRRVVGLSVHFDSDLPHWNLWHTGLERVLYQKGKGADRARYRRTALNLNSSGPGLRAWKRSQLAFQRLGKAWCVPTDSELQKAEAKAMAAQGRAPGDWVLNAEADSALEELLEEAGFRHLVDEGFEEFVANEEKRYAAGAAGKLSRVDKEKLMKELREAQLQLKKQTEELELQRSAAENSAADAKRATDESAKHAAQQKSSNALITTLQNEVNQLRDEVGSVRSQKLELEKDFAETLAGKEQETSNLLAQNDRLRSDSNSLKSDVASLKRQLSDEKSSKAQTVRDLVQKDFEVGMLEKQVSELNEKASILDKLMAKLVDLVQLIFSNRTVYEAIQRLDPLREIIDFLSMAAFNKDLDGMSGLSRKVTNNMEIMEADEHGSDRKIGVGEADHTSKSSSSIERSSDSQSIEDS